MLPTPKTTKNGVVKMRFFGRNVQLRCKNGNYNFGV